jgi:hypothetical protein
MAGTMVSCSEAIGSLAGAVMAAAGMPVGFTGCLRARRSGARDGGDER